MDKYTATWVSHSSISDFLKCPRAYFLKNVYKDPKQNKKMQIMTPSLALGQAVHNTLESLSVLKKGERFKKPLPERFEENWQKISGKRGGFWDERIEDRYKQRGRDMIARVFNNPGPVGDLAVKITDNLPNFWLSEEDEIILCGKIDWLQYLPNEDAVRVVDFKTGRNREDESSLQLPIYHLLVDRCQKRKVAGAAYWYLETDDFLTEKELPDLESAEREVLSAAHKIKLARQLKKFDCPESGCFACGPFERVLSGEGEFVGYDDFGALVYILPTREKIEIEEETSIIL